MYVCGEGGRGGGGVSACACGRGRAVTLISTLETFTLLFQISHKTANYCFKTDYFVIQMPQDNN